MKIFKLVNSRTKVIELEVIGKFVNYNSAGVWRVKNGMGIISDFLEKDLDKDTYFSSAENGIKVLIKEHLQRVIRIEEERQTKINELEYALGSTLDLVPVEERNEILLKCFSVDSIEAEILSETSDKSINFKYLHSLLES